MIDVELPFPGEWNELSRAEVVCVARHLLINYASQEAARAAIFRDIFLLRAAKAKLSEDILERVSMDDLICQGLPLLDFVYKENTLTKQPCLVLQYFNRWGMHVKLHGPASDFNSLTCGEFEDAEIYFLQFLEDPKHEHLVKLAAILWRKKGKAYMHFSHWRHRWVSYDGKRRMRFIQRLAPEVLYGIFLWYFGCRAKLPQLFPTVYKGGGKKDDEVDLMAFTKCIHSGAGAKNGSREAIRRTLLKEYFMEMELEAVKAAELEAEYTRGKP